MQTEQTAKQEARQKIAKLVQEFKENPPQTEEQTKVSFITPLFKALGWDMRKDVLYEYKRMDYLFNLSNKQVMVIEAKQPSVNLRSGTASGDAVARQAVGYAWNSSIPIAVVSDFEELLVYHGFAKPLTIKNNLLLIENKYFSLKFEEFLDKFELLWLLSRFSFEENRLDQYLQQVKESRKHQTVDKSILADLLKYREWFTKDIKKYQPDIDPVVLNEAVQKLIDRLIFMRSCEDRGLEPEDQLLKLVNNWKYQRTEVTLVKLVRDLFRTYDKNYNSKLFEQNMIDVQVRFSNEALVKVILGLYHGTSGGRVRYEFDKIPVDLLGSIYEQYLGHILKTTEKRARIEKEKSKRKKMGIYYTPQYIVDYIVRNTVGEAVKGKSLKEILELRILDPACGSASFLQRAFTELCEAVKARIKAGDKTGFTLSELKPNGELYLSQKATIMKNCIFGVDLDTQAVEIAQLALLLKLLEGEGPDTKKMKLPLLEPNIQCGNSLIDDYEIDKEKAFRWESRFKHIMNSGGFDAVIGNPPYVVSKFMSNKEKLYYEENYKSALYQINLYLLFVEKATKLLKQNGLSSYITPNTWLINKTLSSFREYLLNRVHLKEIVDLTKTDVFGKVVVLPVIFILENQKNKQAITISEYRNNQFVDKNKLDIQSIRNTPNYLINYQSSQIYDKVYQKLERDSIPIGNFAKVSFGVKFYQVNKGKPKQTRKIVDSKPYTHKSKVNDKCKKILEGKNIDRYYTEWNNLWIEYGKWLAEPRTEDLFTGERILMRRIVNKRFRSSYVIGDYCNNSLLHTIKILVNDIHTKYLLSLLNSVLYGFYFVNKYARDEKTFPEIRVNEIKDLPIRKISPDQQKPFIKLADRMLDLNKKLQQEKSDTKRDLIKRQIEQTDDEIDQMVYKLYGLTKEEIKIVEESLK